MNWIMSGDPASGCPGSMQPLQVDILPRYPQSFITVTEKSSLMPLHVGDDH
jgi:hypothetical protein